MATRVRRIQRAGKNATGLQGAMLQAAAMRMRIEGYNYEEIATRLGLSNAQYAHNEITTMLKRTLIDTVEQYRDVELLRLESLHKLVWKRIKQGKLELVVVALRIMERRSKLLGLDAPERHDILINEVERLAEETGLDKRAILQDVDSILREASKQTTVFKSNWVK